MDCGYDFLAACAVGTVWRTRDQREATITRIDQQTAQVMADDILTERLPIADGPSWGRIDKPGLGVEIDEDKLAKYHRDYLQHGEFPPYGDRIATAKPAAKVRKRR